MWLLRLCPTIFVSDTLHAARVAGKQRAQAAQAREEGFQALHFVHQLHHQPTAGGGHHDVALVLAQHLAHLLLADLVAPENTLGVLHLPESGKEERALAELLECRRA
jgi:hypothetical protein